MVTHDAYRCDTLATRVDATPSHLHEPMPPSLHRIGLHPHGAFVRRNTFVKSHGCIFTTDTFTGNLQSLRCASVHNPKSAHVTVGGVAGVCVGDAMSTPTQSMPRIADDDGDDDPLTRFRSMSDAAIRERIGPDKQTLLHVHARENNLRMVAAILADGRIDPNARTRSGLSVLHAAIRRRALHVVEILVGCDRVDINATGECARTGLDDAASMNFSRCAALLLRQPRLNVNARNVFGQTSLCVAILKRAWETASLIASDSRTDPNIVISGGDTAIHIAAQNPSYERGLAMLLRMKSVNVNARNDCGKTALMVAAQSSACTNNLALLLADGRTDVNLGDLSGATALHLMCKAPRCDQDALKRLVRHPRIDVNKTDCVGMTAAEATIGYGNATALEAILSTGRVDVYREGAHGTTLVEAASSIPDDTSRMACVRVLAPYIRDMHLVRHACAYPFFKDELVRRSVWGLSAPYADARSRSSVVACLILISARGCGAAVIKD